MTECPYCKEQIQEGAKKCRHCESLLGSHRFAKGVAVGVSGALSLLVSLGSIGIAFLEFQGRVEAQEQQEMAERNTQAAEDILSSVPDDVLRQIAEEQLNRDSAGYKFLQEQDWSRAAMEYQQSLEQNPSDEEARKGVIYSRALQGNASQFMVPRQ